MVVGIALGASREFVFINLNYQIDHLAYHTRFSYAHSMVQRWTAGWGLDTLLAMKWVLAMAFMAVMALLCVVMARILFSTWWHARWIVPGFVAFALFSLGMQYLARWLEPAGEVALHIAHMLQYPVPLAFLLIAGLMPRRQPVPGK